MLAVASMRLKEIPADKNGGDLFNIIIIYF